jgi:hypothetical protein
MGFFRDTRRNLFLMRKQTQGFFNLYPGGISNTEG